MLPPTIDGQTARIARLERELWQTRLQVRELQGRLHSAQVLLSNPNRRNEPEPVDDDPDPMEHLNHD